MKIAKHIKGHHSDIDPPDSIQIYIGEMLVELSKMAQANGLRELASLLRATHVAAAIEAKIAD